MAGEKEVSSHDWLALFGVMLGAFMAVLDIQITNSSLKDISGAIGSSLDEGSWISTAYLVAEIIAIGVSGIMADVFSIKRYLLFSATGFLIFSVLCAFCGNLSELIICRALQGLTGGALIPLAFSTILVLLPKSKQSIGLALFGFTATFGPSIGPSIGGWLTDNYGWQWIFFINIPPGVALIAIVGPVSSREKGASSCCGSSITLASSPWRSVWARSSTSWKKASARIGSATSSSSASPGSQEFSLRFSSSAS